MKAILIILSITTFFSCQFENFNVKGIEKITIVSNLCETLKDTLEITDKQKIELLADVIKRARREPVKFMPNYKLELKFRDSSVVLLARKNLLKNKGFTYLLNDDIGKIIEDISASN
jgi:hypothetical protein